MDVYLSHEAIREELTGQCKSSMGFPLAQSVQHSKSTALQYSKYF